MDNITLKDVWNKLAVFILKYRLALIIALAAITVFMGYKAKDIQMSYKYAQVVPQDDPEMIYFMKFKALFGEDGNVMALGIKDPKLYTLQVFGQFAELVAKIEKQRGVSGVVSLANLRYLNKNQEEKRFESKALFDVFPKTQVELDSALAFAKRIKVFDGQLFNQDGATVVAVSFDKKFLNSKDRQNVVNEFIDLVEAFEKETGVDVVFAGLPYVRTVMSQKVQQELNFFIKLSFGITAVILFLFFRSLSPVIYPLIVIGMVVIWTMGTVVLLGYQLTLITGLLPPILIVIGIPNCIYLVTKYHQECLLHNNKEKAIQKVIGKIGIVTLITNATTAVGFIVLAFTNVDMLEEFGIVAGINIVNTFVISIVFIPAVFSYLPFPKERHVKHLDFKPMVSLLVFIERVVDSRRSVVYAVTCALVAASVYGAFQIRAISFMVDDLPKDSQIKKDLTFFEDNFKGIMPLEILVDTGKKKGFRKRENIQKIEELQDYMATLENVSPALSIVTLLKAANQAYWGSPDEYVLPSKREEPFVYSYLKKQSDTLEMANQFTDSTGQIVRISMKVADMGSKKMDSLVQEVIRPNIARITKDTDLKADVTGTTWLFIKGNQYLIKNLWGSLIIAFVLIAIIMGVLFRNARIIILSVVSNSVPLLLTAGIMGYFGVALKPSTALIFSIAFGIAVDDAIHFLAKYRQELFANQFNVKTAVAISIRETGTSMVYTSLVLFAGFVIFAFSEFGGTVALGVLTSTTLIFAMITNLLLLPCLLRTFDPGKHDLSVHPLIEHYNEFYQEEDDEEIDLGLIGVKKPLL